MNMGVHVNGVAKRWARCSQDVADTLRAVKPREIGFDSEPAIDVRGGGAVPAIQIGAAGTGDIGGGVVVPPQYLSFGVVLGARRQGRPKDAQHDQEFHEQTPREFSQVWKLF